MRHHRSYAMHPPCPTNSPVPVPVPAARPIVPLPPMPRTAAALAVFDAQKPQLEALWAEAECNDDVYAAIRAEKEAWLAVQEAFATESPNSLERCRLVEPNSAWLRQLVERSQRENQEVVMGLEEKRTGVGGRWPCAGATAS